MKLIAPEGVRITALPGSPLARPFSNAALFGLRPGYVVRFELANAGTRRDATLFAEIEVRGSLMLRPGMVMMDHYACANWSMRDLDRAAGGAVITKVIYLEDPLKAVPLATTLDAPHEIPEDNEEIAIKEAIDHGRLVAIARLGNRTPPLEQLQAQAVPGTVLMPGEQYLPVPTAPPVIAHCGVPLYDPLQGPKYPHEECLTDGGDTRNRLGIRDNGVLGGLDSTDTSAEFTVLNKRKVVTSNTVCICAPRFVIRRVDTGLGGYQTYHSASAGIQRYPAKSVDQRMPPMAVVARVKPNTLFAMIHAQIQAGVQSPIIVTSTSKAKVVFNTQNAIVAVSSVEPDEVVNSQEFLLVKDVEPAGNVKVGDVVTITLRYTNRTGKSVTDVVVSDSLSGRLEYVPGTTQSDRPVNVTTAANENGSVIVRFEVPGTLLPGQGGVVRFKAKIR
jgi:uncharacterized repeat protein (TIGR01451 family)